jgi:uncharacterized protein (TIGR00106 family)
MVLLEFSLYPTDKGESVSDYVKRNLEIIDDSGLPYRLGPMGTTLEGEYDQVMAVVKRCFDRMSTDCGRVACQIKIDYRAGRTGRLDAKVQVLKDKTGRDLAT